MDMRKHVPPGGTRCRASTAGNAPALQLEIARLEDGRGPLLRGAALRAATAVCKPPLLACLLASGTRFASLVPKLTLGNALVFEAVLRPNSSVAGSLRLRHP